MDIDKKRISYFVEIMTNLRYFRWAFHSKHSRLIDRVAYPLITENRVKLFDNYDRIIIITLWALPLACDSLFRGPVYQVHITSITNKEYYMGKCITKCNSNTLFHISIDIAWQCISLYILSCTKAWIRPIHFPSVVPWLGYTGASQQRRRGIPPWKLRHQIMNIHTSFYGRGCTHIYEEDPCTCSQFSQYERRIESWAEKVPAVLSRQAHLCIS